MKSSFFLLCKAGVESGLLACTLQHSGLGGNASFGNWQGEKVAEQSEAITRPLLECWGQRKGMEGRKRKHERYHFKSRLEPQLASPPFLYDLEKLFYYPKTSVFSVKQV